VDDTLALLGETGALEAGARRLAGRMAACLQGALLVRFAPPEVADAFCASRLGTSYDGTYGTLSSPVSDLRTIVTRATPEVP
jgi:putative acyl-CoA dehydrogenase